MADTTNIDQYLKDILEAIYGEEVRSAIHDSIKQCYIDKRSVYEVKVNDNGHLVLTYLNEDGTKSTIDYGDVRGPKGDTGAAGDIDKLIVSAQTGDPGTSVHVTQTKTSDDKWDVTFTIPRGDPGNGDVNKVDGITATGTDKNVELNAVSYGRQQNLTDAQKLQARTNIGVLYHRSGTITLYPEYWAGTEAPYTYSAALSNVVDGDGIIGMSPAVTAEQYTAFCDAQIVATGLTVDSATNTATLELKAFGTKPTIQLPASLMVTSPVGAGDTATTIVDEQITEGSGS